VLHEVTPPQQACPDAPQGAHIPALPAPAPWHDRPDWQAFAPPPRQQAPPFVPHAVHIDVAAPPSTAAAVVVHLVPEAVQVPPPRPPPQQAWSSAPQLTPPSVWQEPLLHIPAVPPPMHVAPLATHIPPVQQPPPLQVLAAQQGRPVPPQVAPTAPPTPAVVPPAPPLRPPTPTATPPPPPAPPLTGPPPPPQAAKLSERASTRAKDTGPASRPPSTLCTHRFSI